MRTPVSGCFSGAPWFEKSDGAGYQGQGVGSLFIEQIKTELCIRGIHAAILCTEAGYPAYGFYVKNGFSKLADTRFLAAEF